jgi:LysM repeat protein
MNYRIQAGDTLWALSRRYGTTVDALMRANPQIANRNLIYTGRTLNIPGKSDSFDPGQQPVRRASGDDSFVPSKGGSNRAFQIARSELGKNAGSLKLEHSAVGNAMADWVPNNVNCANFVSGCLVAAGQIRQSQTSASVYGLMGNLDRDSNFRRVTLANAQPGDVVSMKTPHGQHVVMFAGWSNGKPMFIGSNNVNPDGSQRVTQGNMSYPIMAIHHYVG